MEWSELVRRFWERVEIRGPDECWPWTGTIGGNGYGQLPDGRRGSGLAAHRFSEELHHGPIPDGHGVMHSCDNPPCVNPAHLSAAKQRTNLADARAKGRRPNVRVCTIHGCEREHHARGVCFGHYQRLIGRSVVPITLPIEGTHGPAAASSPGRKYGV